MKVMLVGWNYGLQTIPLIKAVMQYSGAGLGASKKMVEALIDGESISLEFEKESEARDFSALAKSLGAVVLDDRQ